MDERPDATGPEPAEDMAGEPTGETPPESAGEVSPPESPDAPPEGGGDADAAKPDGASEAGPDGEPEEPDAPEPGRYVIQARYGALPEIGLATVTDPSIPKSALCVIRTKRGTEIGMALSDARPVDGDVGETIGHVLRRATDRDMERQKKIEGELEPDELDYCRQKIKERGLQMRLSSVEHIWGGERIVYHFTAERRVDFRALVRDLAWHFHTRIELRQIGARDEARLLADYEHCGQPLCCRTFLRSLEPVTMRMAKLQRTTLDPSKISGRCGRLMCCLRFEDAVYRELRKGLPKRGTRVAVGSDEGTVVSTEILTQQVAVRLGDGRIVHAPVSELKPPGEATKVPAEGGSQRAAAAPATVPATAPAPAPRKERTPRSDDSQPRGGGGRKGRRRGRPQGPRQGAASTGADSGSRKSDGAGKGDASAAAAPGPDGASAPGGSGGANASDGTNASGGANASDGANASGGAAGATDGSQGSAQKKPGRRRKGRRRGGRSQRGRPKGGGGGGGTSGPPSAPGEGSGPKAGEQ